MHASAIVLQLAGAVMLLLFATRMVKTGFERAAGPALRSILLKSCSNPFTSVITGTAVAALLQSSTAVALLVAGFASSATIALNSALIVVLGADLGTALVVQFLSCDLAWLTPALLLIGGFLFLKVEAKRAKQIGRILLGIAFILLSLKLISEATHPLRDAEQLSGLVNYLSRDVFGAFAGGLLLAFLFHSSVAAILLFATLCAQAVIPLEAGIPLVLGANAGGALVALWLNRGGRRAGRRVTLANFIFRLVLGMLVLLMVHAVQPSWQLLGDTAERQLVNFHLLFNFALLVLCLPLVKPVLRLTDWLTQADASPAADPMQLGSALDQSSLHRPDLALASVTRELLRMSQLVEIMIAPLPKLFSHSQPDQVERIRKMDDQINQAHTQIKLYIAELNRGQMNADQSRRGVELTSMAINLERAGDLVAKDLMDRVDEKHLKRREFSEEGWREIVGLHAHVADNIQLALNVMVSEDLESAIQLVEEKARIRKQERDTRNRHLLRLMRGTPDSIATSDLHLEAVRALKEINSLYTAVAYPILSANGVLLDNRIAASATQ